MIINQQQDNDLDDELVLNDQEEIEIPENQINVKENIKILNLEYFRLTDLNIPLNCFYLNVLLNCYTFGFSSSGTAPLQQFLPYSNLNSSIYTTAEIVLYGNVNALFLVGISVGVTLLFIFFFWRKYLTCLKLLVLIFYGIAIGFYPAIFITVLFSNKFNIPVDYISIIILQWNFLIIGLMCLLAQPIEEMYENFEYVREKIPKFLSTFFLLVLAAAACLPLLFFDELTIWLFLIWMVIYDLVAVLCPFGPLYLAMQINQERIYMAEDEKYLLPEGMIVEGLKGLYTVGLGDIIFYGLLFGLAAGKDFTTLVGVYISLQFGFIATVYLTVTTSKSTLPALPIPISLAIISYIICTLVVSQFVNSLVPYY